MPLTEVHSQGVLLSQGAGLTGVQPSQACNPHRRATLTGVQPSPACSSHGAYISQACSSDRRVALTGVQLSRGIALIGYISHECAALTGV
jgi:hypothetical protein